MEGNRESRDPECTLSQATVPLKQLKIGEHPQFPRLPANARREPFPSTSSNHSEQLSHLSHRICTTYRTLLIRVRVKERRQRNDHIRCNQ